MRSLATFFTNAVDRWRSFFNLFSKQEASRKDVLEKADRRMELSRFLECLAYLC
jgi:hypothetical protein